MASASVKLLTVCFAFNFSISLPLRSRSKRQPAQTLRVVPFIDSPSKNRPNSPRFETCGEEVVTQHARNFEAHVNVAMSRDNWLLQIDANRGLPGLHRSTPKPCLRFLVGQ